MTNPSRDAEGCVRPSSGRQRGADRDPGSGAGPGHVHLAAEQTQWLDVLAEDLSAAADRRGAFTDQADASRTGELLSSVSEASDPQLGAPGAAGDPGGASTLPIVNTLVDALARAVAAETQVARGPEAAATRAALLAFEAVATARSAATIGETGRQTALDVASRVALSPSVHDEDAVTRAVFVAEEVSAAAAADAAMALELTVRSAAVEVQTVAALTARRVAEETDPAIVVALATR